MKKHGVKEIFAVIMMVMAFTVQGRKIAQEVSPTPEYDVKDTDAPLARQEVTPEPQVDLSDINFEYVNPQRTGSGLELFESDMVLTEDQKLGRQAVTNLWTSPVSFAIESTSENDRAAILVGIDHWRSLTCIEFNEVSSGSSTPHLSFFRDGGCWSYVGKVVSSGAQQISIGSGCSSLGVVAHEVGHAMGILHQQSRADRDTYVIINSANIQSGAQNNFAISSSSLNHSVPYDLTSTMHYGAFYFSSNGLPTIQTKNILHEGLIGNRGGLSHRDQQLANIMYQCSNHCGSPPTCQNGGFVNKDCSCTCPSHTSGSTCETVSGTYYPLSSCGDANMVAPGTITSPNYPSNFPTNIACFWIITAGQNQQVKVTINDMKMLYRHNGRCYWDYLTLRHSGDIYTEDVVACDEELTGQSFTSTGNQFIVKFVSGNYGYHRGFTADVEFIDSSSTTVTSAPTGSTGGSTTSGPTGSTGGSTTSGPTGSTGGSTTSGPTGSTGGSTTSGPTGSTGGSTSGTTTAAPGGNCGGARRF